MTATRRRKKNEEENLSIIVFSLSLARAREKNNNDKKKNNRRRRQKREGQFLFFRALAEIRASLCADRNADREESAFLIFEEKPKTQREKKERMSAANENTLTIKVRSQDPVGEYEFSVCKTV